MLKGKVAVITGGGGVLCSCFAKALAAEGCKVAVLNRTLSKAELVVDDIRAAGGEAIAVAVNVLKKDTIEAAHEAVLAAYGPCDILVNGAGGNNPAATCDEEFFSEEIMNNPEKKSFFDLSEEGFSQAMDLNLIGVLLPTQIFAKDMVEKKQGAIINISSMNAFTPLTKIPAYSAAKSGLSNFTQWLAVYFANTGVRCNAIAPGFFSAEQNRTLLWNADGTPTARAEKILRNTPMGRFGKPEELLGALKWLADDEQSGFVTGVVVPVDGGFSAYSGV